MLRTACSAILMAASGPLLIFSGCGGNTSNGDESGSGAGSGTSAADAAAGTAGVSGTGSAGEGGTASGGASGGRAGAGATAGDVPPEWRTCSDTSQCVVREARCCEFCGPSTLAESAAVNGSFLELLSNSLCMSPHPVPCPAPIDCLEPSYVVALCIDGLCTALDVREDLLTSCADDAQCRLRWGTGCCEALYHGQLVAVNSQVNYGQTVCGDYPQCPKSPVEPYPQNAGAVCGMNHHCQVVWSGPTH